LAFELLVALGVALTYGCWLLVPWLARAGAMADRPAKQAAP
jgi:hypothetical protein